MECQVFTPFTDENFDEGLYLASNPDVRAAIEGGHFGTGRRHFELYGRREGRSFPSVDPALRAAKMERLRPFLRDDMPCTWRDGKADYLTPALREAARITETENVSVNGYDGDMIELVRRFPDGLVLDCGAGSRSTYFHNVVNYEIVDYPSTDVLGIGEELPFRDDAFDAVISVAVLEHVRDPFRCAREIARVLRPGGRLYCCVPFLQPYHGYPHHYFNATPQGIRRLFEDALEVEDVRVLDSTHPIWSLAWILESWERALPPRTRKAFRRMTVADLLAAPAGQVVKPFCRDLPAATQLELASATVLTARKG